MKAIPVLKISSIEVSHEFYSKLGFTQTFLFRPDPNLTDPVYAGYEMDGASIHLSSHSGDSNFGTAVFLLCDSVDTVHEQIDSELVNAIKLKPTNQTWGNREMYLEDPDGHSLRFIEPLSDE